MEDGMATHSSIFPMDRGAWQAAVCRVAQNWTQLRDLLSPCKIYHQFPASHKITCWDFDIHGKCFLGFFFSFYLPPFLKKATFEESARLFPFLAKARTFFIGLDLVHIGG